MALQICEECRGSVSSQADKCPHCGCCFDEPSSGFLFKMGIGVVLGLFIFIILPLLLSNVTVLIWTD